MVLEVERFGRWHELFDALCVERGHYDNLALAGAFCARTGAGSRAAYEAALKNLNNWRQGHHRPSPRNFRILTQLLELDADPALLARWNALYKASPSPATPGVSDEGATPAPTPTPAPPSRFRPLPFGRRGLPIAAACLALAAVVWGVSLLLPASKAVGVATVGPIDVTGQQVYYLEQVTARVGESAVIHGKRGLRCGEQPPPWEEVLPYLPELSTGVWTDGGVGFRVSRACGGATPVRAVVFTATRPGLDAFLLYDDPVTLRVVE